MIIRVTEQGFVWRSPEGEDQIVRELTPPFDCADEELLVRRGGEVIDRARIHWIGTHGAEPNFHGLKEITGNEYHNGLLSTEFQIGDELHIDLSRAKLPESEYWARLSRTVW